MPFFPSDAEIQGNHIPETSKTNSKKSENCPIFLLPSIIGIAGEYQHIVKQLREAGETRPIYVYCDPFVSDQNNDENNDMPSLQQHAKDISDEIKKILGMSGYTPLLVGYSFGGTLAPLVAQELNQKCFTYLIDSTSPEVSKKYFNSLSTSVFNDLINIVKYAAELACPSIQKQLEKTDLSHLIQRKNTPIDYIAFMNEVATALKQEHPDLEQSYFDNYIYIAKKNIFNLTHYEPQITKKLDQLFVLMTQETSDKYESPYGGWNNHTQNIRYETNYDLHRQNHMELLKGKTPELINSLLRFIKSATAAEHVLKNRLDSLDSALEEFLEMTEESLDLSADSLTSGSSTPPSITSFSDDEDNDDENPEKALSADKQNKIDQFLARLEKIRLKAESYGNSSRYTLFSSPPKSALAVEETNSPAIYERRIKVIG